VQRRFRLTSSEDFKRVRRFGKSYAHPLLVLIVQGHERPAGCRVGVAAGRSVGSAVRRNRAKRLIREAIRPLLLEIKPGWDLVVLARQPLESANLAQTQEALLRLLRRANLINQDRP
jgi:ribonuclease P protein component